MSRRGGKNKIYEEDSPEPEAKRPNKRSSQQPSTSQESATTEDEPGNWSCSVCTYRNSFESFKCEICESRKGTSTRKPRLNPSVVQQQTLVQLAVQQQSQSPSTKKERGTAKSRFSPESNDSGSPTPSRVIKKQPKLKKDREKRVVPFSSDIVDRNSPKKRAITVRGITFMITEYKPKRGVTPIRNKRPIEKPKKEVKKDDSS